MLLTVQASRKELDLKYTVAFVGIASIFCVLRAKYDRCQHPSDFFLMFDVVGVLTHTIQTYANVRIDRLKLVSTRTRYG